jgi:hypothetical protein
MDNFYKVDGLRNLRRATELMRGDLSVDDVCMDVLVYFAAGCERIAKSILWNVNPAMTLEDERAENAIAVLYANDIIPSRQGKQKQPKTNSLPYRATVLRAALFSEVIDRHIGLLNDLADMRNEVVHGNISHLDFPKVARFLHIYFYSLVLELCDELKINATDILGADFEDLVVTGQSLQQVKVVGEAVEERLVQRRHDWELISQDASKVDAANTRTNGLYRTPLYDGIERFPVQCPACKKQALVTVEEEQSGISHNAGGFWIRELKCEYCGFLVNDQLEMDYLRLYQIIGNPNFTFLEP